MLLGNCDFLVNIVNVCNINIELMIYIYIYIGNRLQKSLEYRLKFTGNEKETACVAAREEEERN